MTCYEHDDDYNAAIKAANDARIATYVAAEETYNLALYEASAAYGAARKAHGCDPKSVAITAAKAVATGGGAATWAMQVSDTGNPPA